MFASTPTNIMPPTASGLPQFQAFPVPGGSYAHPAFGQTPPAPLPTLVQPTGASWLSDIPVTGNAVVIPTEFAKYLEGGDVAFAIRPPQTDTALGAQSLARARKVQAFNLFTLNHWLRRFSLEANDWVAQNLSNTRFASCSEREFDLAMQDHTSELGTKSAAVRGLLAYRTAHGIRSRLDYLGPIPNQPNRLTSTNIERGSLSAEQGDTDMAWVVAGPAYVQNVWGADAIVGKFLWLQLKRVDDVFQMVPYVSRLDLSDQVPDDARFYTGVNGLPDGERCINYPVGLMVARGRRTVRDDIFLQLARGIVDKTKPQLAVVPLNDAHKACADLERIQIATGVRHHGSFLVLS